MPNIWNAIKSEIRVIANISDHIDTDAATRSIRSNVSFRGPNVWILAFSIIIASVGLNVNSTAVIIGAMLISPLMGPIIGIGLGLGVNDTKLIRVGLKNLIVMVGISLIASTLYFLLTPLKLANPTELLARTNPTIYDVIIALFGGAAGLLEISRKEKGTVLSGVAIATALMPPLCTAGYGLATGTFKYFFGALMLFIINGVFIIIATYVMSKILGFQEYEFQDQKTAKRTRTLVTLVVILVAVPSILSAVRMIKSNTFQQNASSFVADNRMLSSGYIYDYEVDTHKGGRISLYIAGSMLDDADKEKLKSSARDHGIDPERISFYEHQIVPGEDRSADKLVKDIYERTDSEISKREAEIRVLENELTKYRQQEIPYLQISRELTSQFPQVKDIYISRGADINTDSLSTQDCILVVARTERVLDDEDKQKMTDYLKVRLNDTTVVVLNALK
ncbi:MAG: TIGR00341 family protein [Candidatus Cryptobacteroides sp.]|nr:TIGR00341 family protein [Rikenellaceae bacterium]MDY5746462.1 TIGR00341 family protein [Candidatus Cryptobacteroides sp.]